MVSYRSPHEMSGKLMISSLVKVFAITYASRSNAVQCTFPSFFAVLKYQQQANNDFIKIRITAALYTFATCTLDDPYGITNGSDDGQLLKSVRSFFQTLSEIIQSFVATIVKIYSCQMKSFQRNEKRYGFKIIRFNVAIS